MLSLVVIHYNVSLPTLPLRLITSLFQVALPRKDSFPVIYSTLRTSCPTNLRLWSKRSVSATRDSQTLQTDSISPKMDSHEIHPPPAVQIHPHFPTRETISTTESSVLDIPHHDAEWTTFLTMSTQNRIVDASPGSASAETDCLGFSGDKFCATAIQLTSWGSVHRVLSVPAESPFQSIRGGTEQVKTSSSTISLPDYPRGTPSSLNIRPSSQLVPSTSATTLQTQTVSSHHCCRLGHPQQTSTPQQPSSPQISFTIHLCHLNQHPMT